MNQARPGRNRRNELIEGSKYYYTNYYIVFVHFEIIPYSFRIYKA